jgi:serine/threonine-protein kinase
MSAVWLAEDEILGREVAVKLLHVRRLESEDAVERFEREARTLAALAHPGIVTVIDRGEHDGRPYIVFEYVRGEDLRERIASRGRLEPPVAIAICRQVADALSYAHAHGVIHRDVKPHNVLLTEDGVAKLTDFGIARILQEPSLTSTGRVLGTGEYVAPEQAIGTSLDARADVYALGVMLFHCLTGETPYTGGSFVELAEQHLHAPVPRAGDRVEGLPDGVDDVLARSLAKRPEDRYPDCASMGDDLQALLVSEVDTSIEDTDEIPIVTRALAPSAETELDDTGPIALPLEEAAPPEPSGPAPGRGRRRRLAYGALLAAVLLVAAGWAGYLLGVGSGGGTPRAGTTRGSTPSTQPVGTTPAAPKPQLVALEPLTARSFDPPPGDGTENEQLAPLAVDSSPATAWATERYRGSPDANGKGGVGLIVDAGRAVDARALRLIVPDPGWSGRIYTTTRAIAPAALAGWTPASKPFTVAAQTTVPLHTAASRLFLIWITNLVGTPGSWLAEIGDVKLLGPRGQ